MSTTLPTAIIGRAVQLLKRRHARDCQARDRAGNQVDWFSERAAAYCAIGAIRRAAHDLTGQQRSRLADGIIRGCNDISSAIHDMPLTMVSDYCEKKYVIEILEKHQKSRPA